MAAVVQGRAGQCPCPGLPPCTCWSLSPWVSRWEPDKVKAGCSQDRNVASGLMGFIKLDLVFLWL